MTTHAQQRPLARGTKDPLYPDYTQIVVRVGEETFAAIRERAVRDGTNVSEQIRRLIKRGLEAK